MVVLGWRLDLMILEVFSNQWFIGCSLITVSGLAEWSVLANYFSTPPVLFSSRQVLSEESLTGLLPVPRFGQHSAVAWSQSNFPPAASTVVGLVPSFSWTCKEMLWCQLNLFLEWSHVDHEQLSLLSRLEAMNAVVWRKWGSLVEMTSEACHAPQVSLFSCQMPVWLWRRNWRSKGQLWHQHDSYPFQVAGIPGFLFWDPETYYLLVHLWNKGEAGNTILWFYFYFYY